VLWLCNVAVERSVGGGDERIRGEDRVARRRTQRFDEARKMFKGGIKELRREEERAERRRGERREEAIREFERR
jgi:hypothetical protein